MTNTPDKSEMKACPFCGDPMARAPGGFGHTSDYQDALPQEKRCILRHTFYPDELTPAWNRRASSRPPADQVPDMVEALLDAPLKNSPVNGGPQVNMTLRQWLEADTRVPHKRARGKALDAIFAALQAVPAASEVGWQPIESAPKDGTRILIAGGTRQHPDSMGGPEPITQPYIAHWNTLWKQWEGNPTSHDDCYSHEPTHWRPLHAPPALKASGEE